MNTIQRLAAGKFQKLEIQRYLIVESLIFWGLILICWIIYPKENQYSILTHTFSFLGSFEKYHNPEGWWLFTVAMVFWGAATIPVVFFLCRCFAVISRWAAGIGAMLFLAGCLGIALVGLFPDAHGNVIGEWEWTDIHEKASIAVAAGFTLGILWHGLMLMVDRYVLGTRLGKAGINYKKLLWPYVFWGIVVSVAVHFQIQSALYYAHLKAAAQAAGEPIGSQWAETIGTRYSFPLWENIVIYTLFIFIVWFALAVSGIRAPQDKVPS
ncbi:MAG TPA: hypothetical protein PLI09_08425 [Candidatus Hydrogenedentes bacterium]|nr:hypothetical protein [Candidatus Hydrogenedentota bacterium]